MIELIPQLLLLLLKIRDLNERGRKCIMKKEGESEGESERKGESGGRKLSSLPEEGNDERLPGVGNRGAGNEDKSRLLLLSLLFLFSSLSLSFFL